MFLNERIVFRDNLFAGIKLDCQQRDGAVNVCRFGQTQIPSLVVIAEDLDSLLVYDLTQFIGRLSRKSALPSDELGPDKQRDSLVSSILISGQVIESVAVIETRQRGQRRDILLIGCNKSMVVYDAFNQENLFTVDTSTRISFIVAPHQQTSNVRSIFCGGLQKLYAYQMDSSSRTMSDFLLGFELSSERTTSETATCLIHGRLNRVEFIVVGSKENRIKIYSVDELEQSIQTCRLTLTESAQINCLAAIETVTQTHEPNNASAQPRPGKESALPSIDDKNEPAADLVLANQAQMSYFAYGLEDGFIGVYRLLEMDTEPEASRGSKPESVKREQANLHSERLWRFRSKQVPISIRLFDINGDGSDELIVGFRNGRLEVRSPFTGQLLTSTRCFNHEQQLAGLAEWSLEDYHEANREMLRQHSLEKEQTSKSPVGEHQTGPIASEQRVLVACSTTSSLVAFKPRQKQPRKPLIDHLSQLHHREQDFIDQLFRLDEIDQQDASRSADRGDTEMEPEKDELVDPIGSNDEASRWPTSCESKQDPSLLMKIGTGKKQKMERDRELAKLKRELLQKQVENSKAALGHFIPNVDASQVELTHCWAFNGKDLLLRVALRPILDQAAMVEMVELIEDEARLLHDGHLILRDVPTARDADLLEMELVMNEVTRKHYRPQSSEANADRNGSCELKLVVFLNDSEAWSKSVGKNKPLVGPLFERTLTVPRFITFLPENLEAVRSYEEMSWERPLLTKIFGLPSDIETELGASLVREWIHTNFLSLHFNQTVKTLFDKNWLHTEDGPRNGPMQIQASKRLDSALRFSNEEEEGAELDHKFVEFEFGVDERPERSTRRIRVMISGKTRRLTLESDDSDLLVEMVQSLAIDSLKLNCKDHSISSEGTANLLEDLERVNNTSRQLEESERRIETEVFESAELVKNLMDQLSISNELQLFGTSKELLLEIAMLLDGARNSAQAFHLNNQSRLDLMKQANALRQKFLFLSGRDADADGFDKTTSAPGE